MKFMIFVKSNLSLEKKVGDMSESALRRSLG
jgi:hypothetical protein